MSRARRLPARFASGPPAIVILCSAGVAVLGLMTSMLWLVAIAGNLSFAIVGPSRSVHLDDVIRAVDAGVYSTLVSAASIAAASEYWRLRRTGVYVHALATVLLLRVVWLALQGVGIVSVSLVILATMATYLKAKPAFAITAVGLSLTFASFYFQEMGPQIGTYGTECVPIENCFRPLLGAGYPLQYMLDIPGISTPGRLGFEDDFSPMAFALDALTYLTIAYVCYASIGYIRARRSPQNAGAGAGSAGPASSREGETHK